MKSPLRLVAAAQCRGLCELPEPVAHYLLGPPSRSFTMPRFFRSKSLVAPGDRELQTSSLDDSLEFPRLLGSASTSTQALHDQVPRFQRPRTAYDEASVRRRFSFAPSFSRPRTATATSSPAMPFGFLAASGSSSPLNDGREHIGVALGSPSRSVFLPPDDVPVMPVTVPESQVDGFKASGVAPHKPIILRESRFQHQHQRKASSWKHVGSFLGKLRAASKSRRPPVPFKDGDDQSLKDLESRVHLGALDGPQLHLRSSRQSIDTLIGSEPNARTSAFSPEPSRLKHVASINPLRSRMSKTRPLTAQVPAKNIPPVPAVPAVPAVPTGLTPQLQVNIPKADLERYSVMFSSLLNSQSQSASDFSYTDAVLRSRHQDQRSSAQLGLADVAGDSCPSTYVGGSDHGREMSTGTLYASHEQDLIATTTRRKPSVPSYLSITTTTTAEPGHETLVADETFDLSGSNPRRMQTSDSGEMSSAFVFPRRPERMPPAPPTPPASLPLSSSSTRSSCLSTHSSQLSYPPSELEESPSTLEDEAWEEYYLPKPKVSPMYWTMLRGGAPPPQANGGHGVDLFRQLDDASSTAIRTTCIHLPAVQPSKAASSSGGMNASAADASLLIAANSPGASCTQYDRLPSPCMKHGYAALASPTVAVARSVKSERATPRQVDRSSSLAMRAPGEPHQALASSELETHIHPTSNESAFTWPLAYKSRASAPSGPGEKCAVLASPSSRSLTSAGRVSPLEGVLPSQIQDGEVLNDDPRRRKPSPDTPCWVRWEVEEGADALRKPLRMGSRLNSPRVIDIEGSEQRQSYFGCLEVEDDDGTDTESGHSDYYDAHWAGPGHGAVAV